ncbi:MAG TPA: serine protease [Syntrophus sp. (in: bacteria)]|nr:serine protease [Syntrophus sp. (in: bacteria)]
MYKNRIDLYRQIEAARGSKLLVYVTGDRQGMETQIASDVMDMMADHLDALSPTKKISLLLYSCGGQTLSAWTIANLIRQFCDEFEVIIPAKAHSAATLLSLGADRIIMTKQATLGPIDPSVNGPLNPHVPGAPDNIRVPLSVEAVAGYFDLARSDTVKLTNENDLASVFLKLADFVHPVALGDVYRARTQIVRLAKRLLGTHMKMLSEEIMEGICSELCVASGSHDYTFNRREAKKMGLPIDKPDEDLYKIIKSVYDDVRKELALNDVFNPLAILGLQSSLKTINTRSLLESASGGSNRFVTELELVKKVLKKDKGMVEEQVGLRLIFEGWRYEKA